jgi:ankyrin repeat protein
MLAIHVATRKGFTGIIDELLDICNVSKVCQSTGENVLHFAAETGRSDHCITSLAIVAVDANLQDKSGQTPLHLAARFGEETVVKMLLETARVEVNSKDKYGRTPRDLATAAGHKKVAKLFRR